MSTSHRPMRAGAAGSIRSESKGAVAILLAILAMAILGFVALSYNSLNVRMVHRELRNVADAAAHAAAGALCATAECYEDARDAAAAVLESVPLPRGLAGPLRFTLDRAEGPEWIGPDGSWTVRIERGRWSELGGNSEFRTFDPIPSVDTQVDVNEAPAELASNAVRVSLSIRLPRLAAPVPFREGDFELRAQSVAVKGRSESNNVLPFALPVCAVMHDGAFQKDQLTSYDRLFTRAQRFCDGPLPTEDHCREAVPDSFYHPLLGGPGVGPGHTLVDAPPTCSWGGAYPRPPDPGDHFGVVGLPERMVGSGGIAEARILEILGSQNPLISAKLGERFVILPGGLESPQAEEAMWRQISVALDVSDPAHPPYSSVFSSTLLGRPDGANPMCALAYLGFLPGGPEIVGWGVQNSFRFAYNGNRGRLHFVGPGETSFSRGFLPGFTQGATSWPPVFPETPVLRGQVPLVARIDPNGARIPCAGSGEAGDELPDPTAQYEIVGFLSIVLFDVDIQPPPQNPGTLIWAVGQGNQIDSTTYAVPWGFNRDLYDATASPYVTIHRAWFTPTCHDWTTLYQGPPRLAPSYPWPGPPWPEWDGAGGGPDPTSYAQLQQLCRPTGVVRGRVVRPTVFVAGDQDAEITVRLLRSGGEGLG